MLRILVVDDSIDDREMCKRILNKAFDGQACVLEAEGGESCMAILGTGPIDLGSESQRSELPGCMLLDYSLPGHNGIDVLKEVRSRFPYLPVIMLTGQGNENVAVQVMKAGAQDYIVKSEIKPENLSHMIEMAIENCKLRKQSADQQEALALFTRALAHDLKEPIRTILSFAAFLIKSSSGELLTYIERISCAADNMDKLIQTVRAYTQLSDQKTLLQEDCNVQEILQAVLANLDYQIKEKNAKVTAGELADVHGNRAHLVQLMQNLIANAIVHGHQKQPKIHVSSEVEDDKVHVSVEDNGPGIEEKHWRSIFEPFKRLTREKTGSGLGLSICKKIIEHHQGQIWCTSEIGKGSTFHFRISKGKGQKAVISIASVEPIKTEVAKGDLANVLLVDDNPDHIELTKIYLTKGKKIKFNLYTALNGEDALHFIQDAKNPPIHLILLDVNMPIMDGFQFLEHRKKNVAIQNNAVAVCSTSDYDRDMRMSKELGAIDYVQKPVTIDRLREIVAKVSEIKIVEEKGETCLVHLSA